MTSNLPVLLFMVPFLAALVAAALGWIVRGTARWIAMAGMAATAALAVASVPRVLADGTLHSHVGGWAPPVGIEMVLDPLSAFLAAVVALVALVVAAGSFEQTRRELRDRQTVYYASLLILLSGLLGILVTGDLFNLFVHIEVASLAAYALVAAGGRGAPRAGLNYLVLGSMGATLYLIGVGFLYAATGSLNMADVARLLPAAEPRLVLVGGLLIVGGLGVKMALFPLHVWMPAAYARAPAAAATFMAPLVTKVSAYALIRILFWVFGAGAVAATPILLEVVAWAGAGAMVVGGTLALVQTDLRRLLAYSSVGQMGVVALGVGVATTAGMTGAVLHIANDALMKGALFLAAGLALLRFGVREVGDLSALRGRAPWTGAVMAVACISLVGIPPVAGFFGKWYVLSATLGEGRWAFTAAILIGSLASIGYSFRILEPLFFGARPEPALAPAPGAAGKDGPREAAPAPREGPAMTLVALAVLAAAIIGVGLLNASIVETLVLPALPGGLE